MKLILPVFFIFSLIFNLSSQRFDIKFMMEGHLRECIIVKPTTAPPPGGYPIVIMLHGTGQDGEYFYETSGWKELGETENFITVFPTSLRWCYVDDGVERYNYRWVNGNVTENPCSGPPQDYVDDVKFLKKLVSLISDTLPVNASKVYASGFSNGSSMIHKLANDAGDVFSAVAGSGAGLTQSDSTTPIKRIPVWFMLGSKDDRYIIPPYTELPFGGDSILVYLGKGLGRTIGCQGLTSTYEKFETPITHTYRFNESTGGGISSTPYLFTLVKGMFHVYPNGNNFSLSAANLFWEFFKQSVVVSTESNSTALEGVTIYPNPSNDFVNLVIENNHEASEYNIRVLNSFGRIVFEETNNGSKAIKLRKENLGTGLFFIQVESGNKRDIKKMIFN